MAYSLVTYPDPRLKVDHSNPIKFKHYRNSLDVSFSIMEKAMLENNGIGISAVQVGIHLPICIVGNIYIINPVVDWLSMDTEKILEGCLSCPNEKIAVSRAKTIGVSYLNTKGKKIKTTLTGLYARCFLHELDHIHGKLIKDYSAD